MPVSLTNSKDIVANSISVIDYNNVVNIMDVIGQINNIITVIVGNPPLTMNTLEKISQAINNDPQFYNVIINMINSRLPSTTIANYYTKAEVQQMFLNLIDNAPASLDTLNELANALADDANYAATIQNQLALKAPITYVDSQLALKQPTITSSTDLTINKLITRTWGTPTGFTDLRIQADEVYFGNTIWLTATSIAVKFFVPAYAVEGLFIGDSVTPTATINKNGNITTQGTITSGNLTAPNIYTKTEVDGLVSPKSDKTYVDTQLALKANQSTTYTKTEVDTALTLKANQSTTYTKTEVDTALGLKANQSTTYTKTEVDTALALKANQSTTYTKTQVDYILLDYATLSYLNNALIQSDALIRNDFYDKLYINGLIANYYTNSQVNNLLSGKQNTITASTNLTINKLISRTWEPPADFTDVQIKADQVYFGNPVWLTATSLSTKFWSPVYVDQGIKIHNGLSIGYDSLQADTATIAQNGNITTQGTITCQGTLTAPTINATKIICNSFEPTTVNTDMIISANTVLFGDTTPHTILSGSFSNFYSTAVFHNLVYFYDNIAIGYRDANDMFVTRFNINKNGNAYTYGNFDVAGLLTAPNIYNKSQVDNLLNGKQDTITSSTNLTISKLTTRTLEPPTGFTDLQIKADQVYFGNTVWLTATSISVKFWAPVYIDQGITVQNGLSIGMYSAGSPNQFAQTASITQTGNITTQGTITCQGDLSAPNIYNKTQVDSIANTKQNTITSATSINANNINAAGSITSGTATLTTITAQTINTSYLNATQGIVSNTLTTNTITTNGTSLYIKKDSIQIQASNAMNMIDLSPTQTILYNEVLVDSLLKTNGNIIVGSYSGPTGWTDKCKFEPTGNGYFAGTLTTVGNITSNTGNITSTIGNISAYGNIESYNGSIYAQWGSIVGQSLTSTGNITCATGTITGKNGSFQTLAMTGGGTTSPTAPSGSGIFIGNYLTGSPAGSTAGISLCGASSSFPYLSFVAPGDASYWRGLIQFSLSSLNFHFSILGSGERLRIGSGGVSVYGTFTNSSDKRLKFNVKPLFNALDVINRLEPVEYDQTYTLVDDYTPETPQSHQSGLIAQSVHKIDELKHAVEGGEVGEDGVESIRTLNYNAIFTYAVKAIQELSDIVKQQQIQIDAQKQQIDKLINIILTS